MEDLSSFTISGNSINNIKYVEDTVLMAEAEIKLRVLLDNVLKKS